MKLLRVLKSYLLLLALAITDYVGIYILGCLIIFSHFLIETNFSFISDTMKIMLRNIAYTSPSILMVEVTAIMGRGYIVSKVTEELSFKNSVYSKAYFFVLLTISVFFIIIFFRMIFSETHFGVFGYLITTISPILCLLGSVINDKY